MFTSIDLVVVDNSSKQPQRGPGSAPSNVDSSNPEAGATGWHDYVPKDLMEMLELHPK